MGKALAEIPLAPFDCERTVRQSWSLHFWGATNVRSIWTAQLFFFFFFPDVFARNNIYHTAVKETRALKEEIGH